MTRRKKTKMRQLTAKEAGTGVCFEDDANANDLLLEFLGQHPQQELLQAKFADTEGVSCTHEGENSNKRKNGSPVFSSMKTGRKKKPLSTRVDLHGLTLLEAQREVDRVVFEAFRTDPQAVELLIITGKGRHSGPRGGVLAREIHDYVKMIYKPRIVKLESSPLDTEVNGLPFRGHFTVVLSK